MSYGAGCTGTGGPNALVVATLPWAGAEFRATATGMPGLGVVLSGRWPGAAAASAFGEQIARARTSRREIPQPDRRARRDRTTQSRTAAQSDPR